MKIKQIVAALLAFCAFPVWADEVLSLEQCRALALKNNKQIAIAHKTKEGATYRVKAYHSNFFPKLSLSGSFLYSTASASHSIKGGYLPTYVPDASGNLVPNVVLGTNGLPVMTPSGMPLFKEYAYMPDINIDLAIRSVALAGIQAQQALYMGGKIQAAYKLALIGNQMAELNQELTRAEVVVKTDEAYWTYVRVIELQKVAVKYKEVVTELLRIVNNAYGSGMKPKNDVLKVQVKLNEAELQLRQAENGVRLSRMNLCHLIGMPLYSVIMVPENDSTPLQEVETTADITARPEYALLDKKVEMKHQEIKLTRSEFLPNVGMQVGMNYLNGFRLNDENLFNSVGAVAMVTANIPLVNWGEGKNKIRVAKVEKEIMELERKELNEKMQLELAQAFNRCDEAVLEVELSTRSLLQAEENMAVSFNQYKAGMETLANYMEAQTMWQKASADAINARASQRLLVTQFLKSAGKL